MTAVHEQETVTFTGTLLNIQTEDSGEEWAIVTIPGADGEEDATYGFDPAYLSNREDLNVGDPISITVPREYALEQDYIEAAHALTPNNEPELVTFTAGIVKVLKKEIDLRIVNDEEEEKIVRVNKERIWMVEGFPLDELQAGYENIPFTMARANAEHYRITDHLGIVFAEVPATDAGTEKVPAEKVILVVDSRPALSENQRELRTDTITAVVTLTDDEMKACAQRMADAVDAIQELEDDLDTYRKNINAQIKETEKDLREASRLWNKGKEERKIDCYVIGDYDTGELFFVEREYPYREIQRRPMTEKDRQIPLPMATAPASEPTEADEALYPSDEQEDMGGQEDIPLVQSCANCGHMQRVPEGDEESPCTDCTDLQNWTDEYQATEDTPPAQ